MKTTIEVESMNPKTREKNAEADRGPYIDMRTLALKCGLLFFPYEEELPNQEHLPVNKRETRTAHFLHERALSTGLKFYKKRDMSEMVLAFSVHRLVDSDASLVHFGGCRGACVSTTMSEADCKEQQRKREKRAKEAAAFEAE